MKQHDEWITFALAPNTPLEVRDVSRDVVAERFDGIAATTELVGVRDFGRLYRMRSRLRNSP